MKVLWPKNLAIASACLPRGICAVTFFAYLGTQIVQRLSLFPEITGRKILLFPSERVQEEFGRQNHLFEAQPPRKRCFLLFKSLLSN